MYNIGYGSDKKYPLFFGTYGQSVLKKEHSIKEVHCQTPSFLSFLSPLGEQKAWIAKRPFHLKLASFH
jgi:hypothetical protein